LSRIVELFIPYDHGEALAMVHREGEVVSTSHEDTGARVRARLSDASVGRLRQYVVSPEPQRSTAGVARSARHAAE
jgi:GTP-binding protein HflX